MAVRKPSMCRHNQLSQLQARHSKWCPVVSIASLGGTNNIKDDRLLCNKCGTEDLNEYNDLGPGKTTIINYGTGNSFSSTVSYEYLFEKGDPIKSEPNYYTRGYDLHAVALSGEDVAKKIISDDRTHFNMATQLLMKLLKFLKITTCIL